MFGWEFPPIINGGLGTACYGLTKSLSKKNVDITFVLPKLKENIKHSFLKFKGANIKIHAVKSVLKAYLSSKSYHSLKEIKEGFFGNDLYEEVSLYAERTKDIAKTEEYDVIHAHDWLTYLAGINAKEISGKPLVVHIHNTAFDRSGGNPSQLEYDIERKGFEEADKIVAVSNFTKNKVIEHYDIDPNKILVAHNGIEIKEKKHEKTQFKIRKHDKIVLFLGRMTLQKGPDYFIDAAKRVLEHEKNVKFVMAGKGDMYRSMIEKAAFMGLSDKVLFTGFLPDEYLDKAYAMADVYVMPSVSEPFGITPLEAIRNNCPVIISKQSGVSEVVNHCLKVDFWDVDELANKIVAVLRYSELQESLRDNGREEIKSLSWDNTADKCMQAYTHVLGGKLW